MSPASGASTDSDAAAIPDASVRFSSADSFFV